MGLAEMNSTVAEEMKHIPEGGKYQSRLRGLYPSIRKRDLGKKNGDPSRTPGDAMKVVVTFLNETYPGVVLEYDRPFFGID